MDERLVVLITARHLDRVGSRPRGLHVLQLNVVTVEILNQSDIMRALRCIHMGVDALRQLRFGETSFVLGVCRTDLAVD